MGSYDISFREVLASMVAGGAVGAVLLMIHTPAAAVAGAYLITVMILVTVIDSRQMLIPDILSLPAIPAGLAAAWAVPRATIGEDLQTHVIAAAVAGASFNALRWIYFRWRGIEGLGQGDVKLAAAAGAWLGLADLPMALLLATVSALAAVLLSRRTATATTAVPFGSFIAPSIVVVWLWQLFV